MGEKRVLGDTGCILHLNSGEPLCFSLAFHSVITLRVSWYAPPDTGVSNLIPVAVERLPSIEGIVEIQMDVTFLRGSFLYLQAWGFPQILGFPYEGKLPPEAADEVDSAA